MTRLQTHSSTPVFTEGRLREGRRESGTREESPMREESGLGEGASAGAGMGGRSGRQFDDANRIPVIGEETRLRGFGRGRGKTP